MNVLVVEDNLSNMKLVKNLLEMTGYHVMKAFSAEEGLDIAKNKLPDIIIMDIQLPGMDGVAATKLLKKDKTTKKIPVVAMTSFAMKGDMERFIESGFDGYIAKPFNYKEFIDLINSFLSTSGKKESKVNAK